MRRPKAQVDPNNQDDMKVDDNTNQESEFGPTPTMTRETVSRFGQRTQGNFPEPTVQHQKNNNQTS